MELIIKQLLFGVVLPAIVAGGLFLFARKIGTADTNSGLSRWLVAAALGVGYLAGYLGLEGVPPFPPRLGTEWLCYFALIGLICAAFWHISLWGQRIVQAVLVIAIPPLLLSSLFEHTWEGLERAIWQACLVVAIFGVWRVVQRSFTALPHGAGSPFVYFGVCGGTALVLALSGSLRLAQHGGVLVAVFAAIWLLTLLLRQDGARFVLPSNVSPVLTLLLIGLWMNGYFFAEVPAASALLLAVSPAGAQIYRIPAIERLGARRGGIVQIAASALPVLIAIGIALANAGLFGEGSDYDY